jgi:glycosyltransferase involved in cell wall biosynthesis
MKRWRNILLVTPSFGAEGGVASHVRSSVVALSDSGFEVVVVGAAELPGLDHTPLPVDAVRRFSALIDEVRPDVVHLHDLADSDLITAANSEAPTVASVHGYAGCTPNTYYFRPGQECHRAHGPGCIGNMALRGCAHTRDPRGLPAAYRATTRRLDALRRADHVVAYSHAIARHLQRNGVDRMTVVPLFAKPAAKIASLPVDRRVVFAGRAVGAKGLGVLLAAADGLDCSVEVHGDGWWLPRAREQVERLGMSDRVVFHGWSDQATLEHAYDSCRIVVVPSLWPEPFGLVGIEAMARGRPVVASDTGGVREWLVDGRTGYLVPPGDANELHAALGRLLEDYDVCMRMGTAGAARVAELFSEAAHVAALKQVYANAEARWEQSTARRPERV